MRIPIGTGFFATHPTAGISIARGTYVWGASGTWNGATLQLQTLSADGVTWMNVAGASLTANGQWTVDVGDDMVRVLVTGGPPASMFSWLDLVRNL